MKLVRLELEYFRQHRSTHLTLREGLTGIIGPNGAGKTTLVEAIAFALYGTRALRGKLDEALTRGAPRGAEPTVKLVFEHEGQSFRIERAGSSASIFQGGSSVPLATGSREVAAVVQSAVGMSLEEFFATYFTEQKGLEFLSGQKGAAERERFIIRLMGYDRFEKVQELIRAEKREKKNILIGWEAGLGSREQLEAQLASETEQRQALQSSLEEATRTLTAAEAQYEKARQFFLQSEAKHKEWRKVNDELRQVRTREEERLRSITTLHGETVAIRERLAVRLQSIGVKDTESLAARAVACGEREASLQAKLQELLAQIATLERTWIEQRSSAEAAARLAEAQRSERQKRIRSLEVLTTKGECPTCGQDLGESFGGVLSKEQAVLGGLQQEAEAARLLAQSAAAEPAACTELRSAREQLVGELEALRKERANIERANEEAEELVRKESLQKRSAEELAELKQAQEKLQAVLGSLSFSEDVYARDKGAAEAAEKLTNVARLQRVRMEGELATKQALVERSKMQLIEHDVRVRDLEKVRAEILTLEETDVFLTEFRRHVNASIRPRLAEIASEFISDLTDGRYSTVEVGADFSPTVIDDGESKPIISGGEEDILNLCMRLSLSQMLAERAGHSFSLLVLDEVFGSLDEQRRTNVLALLERLSNRFEQILIITHLDDIKEGVRHLVYVDYNEASGEVVVGGAGDLAEIDDDQDSVANF